MVPGLEQHILKVDLGHALNRRDIKKVPHCAIRCLEMTNRIQHLLVLLWDPVRRLELLVGDLGDADLNDDGPADLVPGDEESNPLLRKRGERL